MVEDLRVLSAGRRSVAGMSDVEGTVAAGFEKVRDGFANGQQDDAGAAQLAVYAGGERVVDLWTGQDTVGGRPYTADSVTIMMSVTKGMTATCAHLLAQQGLLDVTAPVTEYWPEFGQAGKDRITVADLLSHRSGLSGFDPAAGIDLEAFFDWQRCVDALAAMEPLWEPGTRYMYHSLTYGYLVGEVIRRITEQSVGAYFAAAVAAPLGLDLWIGLPEAEEHRVARQFATPQPQPPAPEIDLSGRLGQVVVAGLAGLANAVEGLDTREAHAAEIPAGNGIGNARSLARMYAATIGEVDGVRLLSAETIAAACRAQTDGLAPPAPFDAVPMVHPLRHGLGYELHRTGNPMLGSGSFGHAGAGGRLGFADPESGISVGYVCTNMAWDHTTGPDTRWVPWMEALRAVKDSAE